jgi:CHAD domain-containing protein
MAYRLSLADPLPKALRITGLEVLDDAIGRARDGLAKDPAESIHEIRKDIKMTRSLLRLIRPGIPQSTYRRENRHLRDTARLISGTRDADVLAETVDKLADRFAGRLPKRAFTDLRRRLAKGAAGADAFAGGDALLTALQHARAQAETWPLDRCDRATLRAGVVRAYARGCDALAAVEKDRSVDRLHSWRKRVKDLWYHQRLLRDMWPAPMEALADESHRLSDLLGDDHDLAMLRARLAESAATVHTEAILALIDERRTELQEEALRLGRRIYAETPKAYGRRVARYLAMADTAPATSAAA